LLPNQILLNNFLSDVPAVTIASDRLDPQRTATPGRFRTREIGEFMIVFGSISSVFDLLSFYVIVKLSSGRGRTPGGCFDPVPAGD
jgi:Mg2+-importing ATPase